MNKNASARPVRTRADCPAAPSMNSPKPVLATASGRDVTAVLGPTNTGKTHLAIERMAGHRTGLIGLPLRLLAREVYQRLCEKVGYSNVALITGEEKITPDRARYQVCTVEAMPSETDAEFVAIDEVQLAADMERGHVFTDRLMHLRGRHETLLLGAQTVERVLRELLPGIDVVSRPRMSMLQYAGSKKITRMPARSAIVAFSVDEVYAIAELIRRQRGGAAVVLGSLSPRTRNAQVALYQSGDVDFLVATDAIGMGLNLDLDHVAFAQDRKFDGFQHRRLTPAEMAQIAGRAGRYTRDGTFGVTGKVAPFEDELVQRLETHSFDPQKVLIWRNRSLDFSSIGSLRDSLEAPSASRLLLKARPATDVVALETLARDMEIADICATGGDLVRLLWEVCLTPDYRKISPASHAQLLGTVFTGIARHGHIGEDWFAGQVDRADRAEGDVHALSARIAEIRTWTYLSNRPDWLQNATYWQEKTRDIENRLSDALHEGLTKRFIDRRTSVLMKRLRENRMLESEVKSNGDVTVEGHHVGRLMGFRFTPETAGDTPEARAQTAAAMKALAAEIERRANRLAASANTDIVLSSDASLRWMGEPVAKLVAGDTILRPKVILLADEQLTGPARDQVAQRLDRWVMNHLANVLKPLIEMPADQTLEGMARGVAYRLVENLGNIDRREIASDVQSLDQDARAGLRRHGVRFGFYNVFIPALLKPAPASLLCQLWGIFNGKTDAPGLTEVPEVLASGRTSTEIDPSFETEAYRLCGYRMLGKKAVRIDILERLADLIRPAMFWKPSADGKKPEGAIDGRSFYVTPAMMSILGATHEDMELILKGLGYRGEPKPEAEIKPAEEEVAQTAAADTSPDVVAQHLSDAQEAEDEATTTHEPEHVASAEETGQTEADAEVAEHIAVAEEAEEEAIHAVPSDDPAADKDVMPHEASAAEDAEAGPKMIVVWRQGRAANKGEGNNRRGRHGGRSSQGDAQGEEGDRQGRKPGGSRHGKGQRPGGRGPGKGGGKPGKGGQNQFGEVLSRGANPGRQKKEREPDPDSPFAKLAALKDSLNKK